VPGERLGVGEDGALLVVLAVAFPPVGEFAHLDRVGSGLQTLEVHEPRALDGPGGSLDGQPAQLRVETPSAGGYHELKHTPAHCERTA
jgi:hypothetical protein